VIAALSAWHEQHDAAAAALRDVRALPAHVTLEAFSILTGLPGGLAVPAATAAAVLNRRFDEPPLTLSEVERPRLVVSLAAAGVFGGASYDGLVGMEAAAHDETLLTLDQRAVTTYRRLGVRFRAIAA
jgi:2'-5' RNA ligase